MSRNPASIRARLDRLEADRQGGIAVIAVPDGQEDSAPVQSAAEQARRDGKLLVVIRRFEFPAPG